MTGVRRTVVVCAMLAAVLALVRLRLVWGPQEHAQPGLFGVEQRLVRWLRQGQLLLGQQLERRLGLPGGGRLLGRSALGRERFSWYTNDKHGLGQSLNNNIASHKWVTRCGNP